MNHSELKESIDAYCLGALDEIEQAALEEHLRSGCSQCQHLLREALEVVQGLALSAPSESPPDHLKERIQRAIGSYAAPAATPAKEKRQGQPVRQRPRAEKKPAWTVWGFALAGAAILVVLGVYSQNLRNKISVLERQLQLSEKVVSELRIELSRQERILNVMQSDEIRIVELKGQSTAPQASGKIYWSPEQQKAVFLAFDLPLPPSDKEYQLWMIRNGSQPVDAGVFSLSAQGSGVSVINTIADNLNLTAFAVTLEPRGGVPQPTGDMYLLGAVPSG